MAEIIVGEALKAVEMGWMMAMDEALYDRLEAYEAAACKEGRSMSAYALHWVLKQPAVVSALVGVRTQAQINAALEML